MNKEQFAITDVHIHPFISKECSAYWFQDDASVPVFVERLKRAGVSRCCGSVISLSSPGKPADWKHLEKLNEESLVFRDRYPDFFVPGVHIHPDFPDESCAMLEKVHREGVYWVGELVPYFHGYKSYLQPGAFQIYEKIAELKMILSIHPPENRDELDTLCEKCPDINIILAHPGDNPQVINNTASYCARNPNLYLDLSGSGVYRYGCVGHLVKLLGREKILFGSDFPICNPASYVEGVLFEDISEDDARAIFSGNFERLKAAAGR